jgi:hypothetical protein
VGVEIQRALPINIERDPIDHEPVGPVLEDLLRDHVGRDHGADARERVEIRKRGVRARQHRAERDRRGKRAAHREHVVAQRPDTDRPLRLGALAGAAAVPPLPPPVYGHRGIEHLERRLRIEPRVIEQHEREQCAD